MGFKDCDKVLPPSTFVSLSEDGDTIQLVFMAEPIPREEQYRGKTRYRYYFPVVTKNGLQVWGVGSKLYRTLRDQWDQYDRKCFVVTRRGASGSRDTVYDFSPKKIPSVLVVQKRKYTDKDVDKFLVAVQTFGETATGDADIPF